MPLSSRSTTPTPLVIVPPASFDARDSSPARSPSPHSARSANGATTPTRYSPELPRIALPEYTGISPQRSYFQQEYASDEAELEALTSRLLIEQKIKDGAENLLQVFKLGGDKESLRSQVEAELAAAELKIEALDRRVKELQASLNGQNTSAISEESFSDEDSRTAVASALDALRSLSDPEEQSTSSGTSLARQDQKIEILNGLVQSLHRNRRIKWEIPCQAITEHLLPCLADRESQNLRSATYRAIRYLCCDSSTIRSLMEVGLELFLIKTFSRNATFELEKIEAILMIRAFLALSSKPSAVTAGIVRAMVALAENSDEKLRYLLLETLAELVIIDLELLKRAEGLRVVLQAFIEGPFDLSPHLALAFLPIMDMPETRQLLRPGLDIELVIGTFTSTSGVKTTSSTYDEKLRTCASVVGNYLKTWTGLIYLSMNEKQAIRSFLGGINSTSTSVREAVLDTLYEIFRVELPQGIRSRRNTMRKSADAVKTRARADSASRHKKQSEELSRLNVVEHYLALLLVVLVDAGLLEVLISARAVDADFGRKASILVGELLALSTRVLPVKYATQWQSLPRLFAMVSDYDGIGDRNLATSVLQSIDKYVRQQTRQKSLVSVQHTRARADSLDDSLTRGQRHVESSRIRQGMQIDDLAWKTLLLESQVLTTKEWQKWNFDAVLAAFEGPLLNAARLNEAIKGTKFVRRVMAFFYPFEGPFPSLDNVPGNLKWTQLGCTVLATLCSNPEGVAFLQQERLLRQIAECLSQLDPQYSGYASERIFTEKRFAATIVSGYFNMLGTLSRYQEGLKLMEKAKVFTLLYNLTDLRSRQDIVTASIENLSYEIDGHTRVILSKALNSSFKNVRLFATKHLTFLLQESPVSKAWLIGLLVTQLYDTSTEVRELAVSILNDVCKNSETLELVVEMRPSLDHLGSIGAPLLFRFLSTSVGVRYLHEIEFIERELEHWFHELNDHYAIQLEVMLAKCMCIGPKDLVASEPSSFDGTVPLHFYGELVKTPEGRMILEAKGHFREFVDFIRTHGMEDEDIEVIDKLKSILWAVGHVGSNEGGISFLEDENILHDIAHIASHSKVLSLRGTCYYALGLIACCERGAELLETCHWVAAYTPIGVPTGYCLPEVVDSFLELPRWQCSRMSNPPQFDLAMPVSHIDRDIIAAIANLSNNLLTHSASKSLARIKQRHPEAFKDTAVAFRAIHLLSTCHYRSTVRTYILDLFEIPFTSATVKAILASGEAVRQKKRQASASQASVVNGQSEQRALNRQTMPAIFKLDLDTDSESSDSDDDEREIAPKETLEPVMVMRGFGTSLVVT